MPGGASGAVVTRPEGEQAPPAPQIVLPEQTKFVEAAYPEEARAAGLQAEVTLLLDIDKTGKVTKADVAKPAGHGFDEAAQAAALGFEFRPATRNGKPVAVLGYAYSYRFTIKEVEKPAAEIAPPTVGNLSGTVRVTGVDAPLAGAEVVVTGPDGKEHRTTTDESGKWKLEGLPPGSYRVRVASAGFSPVEVTEEVAVGEATEVTYRLAPEVKGIEVTVTGTRPPREVTRRTIERREMSRIPGTSGDALRSIQSLPGVARPPGLAGLLIVRGSAPQDTAYFVDGATVPLIYHFGGLSSAIPTELLDKIDFYPGNFSAKYGQVMGGIVDVRLRQPDTRCTGDYGKPKEDFGCFHGFVDANLIDTRALVQGPIGKDWTFAVGGRRSWVDVWLKPVLVSAGAGVTTAPVYYDYQAIAETKPTRASRLSLRLFGSDDRLKVLITDPLALDPGVGGTFTFGTSFYRGQALYETELNRSVDLTAMFSAGNNTADFGFGPFKFQLQFVAINARSELGFKIARGFTLHAGMDFLTGPYHVFARLPPFPRPGEASPGPFTTQPASTTDQTGMSFRPAWYLEGEIKPTRRALIIPGIRLDYARDSGHMDFAPRLNGRYDLIGGRGEEDRPEEERNLRTTVKAGVGLFYQPPQYQETDPVLGTPGLLSNRSVHYSVGVEQELNRHIEVGVEGYYKDLTRLVSREQSLSSTFAYGNAGVGSVYGVETLVKYKPDSRFFGWLAYTLSRSVRTDLPGAPQHLFQYDQTHNLTVLGSYRLGRGWEFGARFRLISGNLATPLARSPLLASLYAADAAAYTELVGKPFSERLPLFHQLDLRVDKMWQFRSWRLSAYLDVMNVYDYASRDAISYNFDYTRSTYQTGLPIIPSLGIRGEI